MAPWQRRRAVAGLVLLIIDGRRPRIGRRNGLYFLRLDDLGLEWGAGLIG